MLFALFLNVLRNQFCAIFFIPWLIFSYLFVYIAMPTISKKSQKSTINKFSSQKGLALSLTIEALQGLVMWHTGGATFSANPTIICAGNHDDVIKWKHFPCNWPFTRSFDVSFDLRLNKRLNKQSWGWWFETLRCPLWRQGNEWLVACSPLCYCLKHCRLILSCTSEYKYHWNFNQNTFIKKNHLKICVHFVSASLCPYFIAVLSFNHQNTKVHLWRVGYWSHATTTSHTRGCGCDTNFIHQRNPVREYRAHKNTTRRSYICGIYFLLICHVIK